MRPIANQDLFGVSGTAEPGGGTAEKRVGTVWFAAAIPEKQGAAAVSELRHFACDRDQVRRQSVEYAVWPLLRLLGAHRGD